MAPTVPLTSGDDASPPSELVSTRVRTLTEALRRAVIDLDASAVGVTRASGGAPKYFTRSALAAKFFEDVCANGLEMLQAQTHAKGGVFGTNRVRADSSGPVLGRLIAVSLRGPQGAPLGILVAVRLIEEAKFGATESLKLTGLAREFEALLLAERAPTVAAPVSRGLWPAETKSVVAAAAVERKAVVIAAAVEPKPVVAPAVATVERKSGLAPVGAAVEPNPVVAPVDVAVEPKLVVAPVIAALESKPVAASAGEAKVALVVPAVAAVEAEVAFVAPVVAAAEPKAPVPRAAEAKPVNPADAEPKTSIPAVDALAAKPIAAYAAEIALASAVKVAAISVADEPAAARATESVTPDVGGVAASPVPTAPSPARATESVAPDVGGVAASAAPTASNAARASERAGSGAAEISATTNSSAPSAPSAARAIEAAVSNANGTAAAEAGLAARAALSAKPAAEIAFAARGSVSPATSSTEAATHVEFEASTVLRKASAPKGAAAKPRAQFDPSDTVALLGWNEFERRIRAVESDDKLPGCVIYGDMDQVHVLNKLAGFATGDRAIAEVGAAMQSAELPQGSCSCHLSGDRYTIYIPRTTLAQGRRLAEQLSKSVSGLSVMVHGIPTPLSISFGVALIPANDGGLGHALAAAEAACKAAKDRGRGRVEVYQDADQSIVRRNDDVLVADRLRQALEAGRVEVFAQPIVRLNGTQSTANYELLVRLIGDAGTHLSPTWFMSAATRYRMLVELDRAVVGHVLAKLEAQRTMLARKQLRFSVNLSGPSIGDPDFVEWIVSRIGGVGIPGEWLQFEITETAAVANIAQTQAMIRRLQARGVQFALDDFGTGVSSFAYLKYFDVKMLKLDGSFVRDLMSNRRSESLVRGIAQLGRGMDIETVAECVETRDVRDRLTELGIDCAQGFLFGRPKPFDGVLATELGLPHPLAGSAPKAADAAAQFDFDPAATTTL